jgi:hypothetical protein
MDKLANEILGRYEAKTFSSNGVQQLQSYCENHDFASFATICSLYSNSTFCLYELWACFSLPLCNEILGRYANDKISTSDALILVSYARSNRKQSFDTIARKYSTSTFFLHEMWTHLSDMKN